MATVKGDTLSYSKEGDDRSLKLAFGPYQTVKVTGAGGKGSDKGEMSGVYIAAQDYFSVSVSPTGRKGAAADGDGKKSSGEFILILRRQR
ncbi:MAG: hypothetical protein K2X87_34280 [Gemmataceae bacterium]|nr:hypothetical protein [Gemmataceae bacterium]